MSNLVIAPPLLVIVGATATGKSALAIKLAQRFNGEIICADSRTVYRELDIGTAKPSAADRSNVRHYGLDLVSPAERYTVADFKEYAQCAIREIAGRGKLPIMVGGSGLYIDAVLYNYAFRTPSDEIVRAELQTLSVDELQQRLALGGIALPRNAGNPRHLIRTIETAGQPATRSQLRPNSLLLGIKLDRPILLQRITSRSEAMIADGLVAETKQLSDIYGWDCAALQATSYKAMRGYLEGANTIEEARAEFIQNDIQLAKRQATWFRRNKSIHWLATEYTLDEAVDFATTFLNK